MAFVKNPNGGPDIWDPNSPENSGSKNGPEHGFDWAAPTVTGMYHGLGDAWDMFKGKNQADLTQPYLSTQRPDEERALGLQSRGMQGEYGNLLRAQMAGSGPTVAQAQLAQGRAAAIRGATAAAASARGANTALAGRSAAQSAGRVGMQAARDASLIRAQEQLAAQQQFGALANAQRGQDIQSRQISAAEQQAQLNANVAGMQTRAQVGEGEASRGQLFGGAAMLGLGSIFPSDPDLKTGMQPLGPSYHYSPPETKMNMQPLGSQPAYAPPAAASGDAYGAYSPQQYGALTQAASMTGTQAQPMTPGSPVSTPGLDSTALAAQNAQSAGWVEQAKQQAAAGQGGGGGGLLAMGLGMLGSDPDLKKHFQRLGMSPEQAHAEALKYSQPPPNTDRAPSSFGNVGAAAPYAPNAAPAQQPAYTPTQYNAIQATRSGQENIPLPPGAGPSTDPYQIDRDIMGGSRAPGASRPMTREGTTSSAASQAGQEGGFGAALQAFGSTLGGGKFDALMKAKKPKEKKPEPPLPAPDVSQTPAAQPAYSPKGYAEDVKRQPGQLAQNPYPYQKYGQPPPNPHEGEGEPYFVPQGRGLPPAKSSDKAPQEPSGQSPGQNDPQGAKPPTARFPDLVQAAAAVQPAAFQYKEEPARAQGVTTEDRVGISAERTPGSLADNPVFAPNVQHTPDGTAVVNVPMQTATLTATGAATARKTLELEQELAALKRAALGGRKPIEARSAASTAMFGDSPPLQGESTRELRDRSDPSLRDFAKGAQTAARYEPGAEPSTPRGSGTVTEQGYVKAPREADNAQEAYTAWARRQVIPDNPEQQGRADQKIALEGNETTVENAVEGRAEFLNMMPAKATDERAKMIRAAAEAMGAQGGKVLNPKTKKFDKVYTQGWGRQSAALVAARLKAAGAKNVTKNEVAHALTEINL